MVSVIISGRWHEKYCIWWWNTISSRTLWIFQIPVFSYLIEHDRLYAVTQYLSKLSCNHWFATTLKKPTIFQLRPGITSTMCTVRVYAIHYYTLCVSYLGPYQTYVLSHVWLHHLSHQLGVAWCRDEGTATVGWTQLLGACWNLKFWTRNIHEIAIDRIKKCDSFK